MNYWDKMITVWQKHVTKAKAKEQAGEKLLQRIMVVPKEVRNYTLRRFISQCRMLHSIAFLCWRLRVYENN